jgi:DNA-binding CsgD family transcriptional regulator
MGRGATHEAEELGAEALRLTPHSDDAYRERLLVLARCHLAAGDLQRASTLLGERLAEFPAGPERARAHLLMGEAVDGRSEEAHLELALAEAGDDSEVRAAALIRRATLRALYRVDRLDEAEAWAQAAVLAAPADRTDLCQEAVSALAWTRILRGRRIDDLRSSDQLQPSGVSQYYRSADRPFGVRLAFRGEVARARAAFSQLHSRAEALGDVRFGLGVSIQQCELELRAGDPIAAGRVLDELDGWSALTEMSIVTARLHAVHAALRGEPAEATQWADTVAHAPEDECANWDRLEAVRARGIAALSAEDWSSAARLLASVWDHTVNEGIDDPGAFPVAGDLVEALVLGSDTAAADAVLKRLRGLATDQGHPWGTVTAKRCEAALRPASDLDAAADELLEAAAAYATLGMSFDSARTLLFAGRALRRGKKRAAARRALADAEAAFMAMTCEGWAAAVRLELSRVSGRKPAGESELTPSELRVAELAASGLTNKEIAAQLFVSVYTVEAHLSRAYSKLGVRSRAELARRFTGITAGIARP